MCALHILVPTVQDKLTSSKCRNLVHKMLTQIAREFRSVPALPTFIINPIISNLIDVKNLLHKA